MSDFLDLNEIERLEKEATPGPWKWCAEDYLMSWLAGGEYGNDWVLALRACGSCRDRAEERHDAGDEEGAFKTTNDCSGPFSRSDRELITALRNAAPDLIQGVRRAERLAAFVQDQVGKCPGCEGFGQTHDGYDCPECREARAALE